MLLWFVQHVAAASSLAGLGKITARASLAALVSFLLAVILGPRSIAWLARRFREPIKSDSPEIRRLHQGKQATPTMGGLFIVAGLAGSLLLAGDLTNRYLLLALGVAGGLTLLGAIDDLVKLRSATTRHFRREQAGRPGAGRRGGGLVPVLRPRRLARRPGPAAAAERCCRIRWESGSCRWQSW